MSRLQVTYTVDFDDSHIVPVYPEEECGKGRGVHDA